MPTILTESGDYIGTEDVGAVLLESGGGVGWLDMLRMIFRWPSVGGTQKPVVILQVTLCRTNTPGLDLARTNAPGLTLTRANRPVVTLSEN